MSGALRTLKMLLDYKPKRETQAIERAIGEEFYRAADTTPSMFQRGRSFAEGRAGLEDQFGVKFEDLPQGNATLVNLPGQRIEYPPTISEHEFELAIDPKYPFTKPSGIAGSGSYYQKDTRFMEFDTSGLAPFGSYGGGGAGRGAYAAMYGDLLDDPRKINFTSALSHRNEHRRNYNQAAALLRDKRLARQILIDPQQYTGATLARDLPNPKYFMERSPEEQVGALQAQGALQLYNKILKTANHKDTYPEMRDEVLGILGDDFYHSEDPASFAAMANTLRRSGAPSREYDTIGASALRRAALIADIVGERPGGIRRSLLDGLEYRRGGKV